MRSHKNAERNSDDTADYAQREYGMTEEELDEFVRRTDKRIARERRAGGIKVLPATSKRTSRARLQLDR
jgi:hypothetical protein